MGKKEPQKSLLIVGPHLGDRTCIAFARLLEREDHAFVPPSGYR